MRRSIRTTRWFAVAVAVACAAFATVLAAATPAAVDRSAASAAHPCLVMTGSGDPAFIKNFNPYTATGQPSGAFVQGAFYEPLIITPQGGLKPVPWLARSWSWSNGNKTLNLNIARGVKWSDGKPLTAADVVYSLTAGRQDKLMDRVGLVGAANDIVSIRATGAYKVLITLKTPDS
jgi:peptide/nickel transport system substrate-binding protein